MVPHTRIDGVAEREAEVDARFLLANERTLLAWVRTGLTLMAAGVAARQLGGGVEQHAVVSVVLVLLGTVAVAVGTVRYRAADRALRRNQLPAVGATPVLLGVAVAVVGLGLTVATLLS